MTPPTAAQLDDAIKAETAYTAAIKAGQSEPEALEAAKNAIRENRTRRNTEWIESLGRMP